MIPGAAVLRGSIRRADSLQREASADGAAASGDTVVRTAPIVDRSRAVDEAGSAEVSHAATEGLCPPARVDEPASLISCTSRSRA